jgi:hypothetical protein
LVILCNTWIRWSLVAEFLIKNWYKNTYYLKDWIEWWIKYWWKIDWKHWELGVYFNKDKYKKPLTKEDFEIETQSNWAKIIDVRPKYIYDKSTKKYENISIMYSSDKEVDKLLSKYNKNDRIILWCDNYLNCYYWNFIWYEIDERWLNFIWYYDKINNINN